MISTYRPEPPALPAHTQQQKRAEETDTRQAIHRHDPDYYKKKQDESGGFKDPYDDLTDVSVPALRQFLMDLLERADGQDQALTNPAPTLTDVSPLPPSGNVTPPRTAAISAYQKGAQRGSASTPPHVMPDVPPERPTSTTALDRAASALDRARLVELLRKLDEIMARGITSLGLERGPDFLGTIEQAIIKVVDGLAY